MTEQQETSVGFVLNFAACIAVLFALFVFSLNVTETARKNAHDWAVAQEVGQ